MAGVAKFPDGLGLCLQAFTVFVFRYGELWCRVDDHHHVAIFRGNRSGTRSGELSISAFWRRDERVQLGSSAADFVVAGRYDVDTDSWQRAFGVAPPSDHSTRK